MQHCHENGADLAISPMASLDDLPIERGPEVSYETVRRRVLKFGPKIARRPRQQILVTS